jgi:tetratricopeptide (TPR) repeat protein
MKHFFLIFLINFSIITYCQTADEFRWKGIEKAQEKKYIAAIALFNEALKLEPNSSNIYTLRGDAKFELKDYEGAISDYSNALKLDGSKYLYLTRGNSKAKNKDYNGAIADYNKYIQIEEAKDLDAMVYYYRGIAKSELKDFFGAINDYDKAISHFNDADEFYTPSVNKNRYGYIMNSYFNIAWILTQMNSLKDKDGKVLYYPTKNKLESLLESYLESENYEDACVVRDQLKSI